MPPYQSFLSGQNAVMFWDFVKWFLFFGAALMMVSVAVTAVGMIIQHVVPAVFPKKRPNEKEDDDYDVYRY